MNSAAGNPLEISLVGFDERERTIIASLFKVSGNYQEWQEESAGRPACVLLNADDGQARTWLTGQRSRLGDLPVVAVGANSNDVAADSHLARPFRWVQLLEALESTVQARVGAITASALERMCQAPARPAERESGGERTQAAPRIYRTVASALIVNPKSKGWRYITGELANRGYRVDHVSTAAAAVMLLANFRYNLIFVETHLPDEDGVGICRMLRQAQGRRRVASVILSTNRAAVDRIRETFAGCDAYISTPVDPDELAATLDRLAPEYVLEE